MRKNRIQSSSPGKQELRKGHWTATEDDMLRKYVEKNGERQWPSVPKNSGLKRCGKSCRLRWLNYLRPTIKRGHFEDDERDLIIRMHKLLGNRWSLIAKRIPGRTDNEIKNYWNTYLSKDVSSFQQPNKVSSASESETIHEIKESSDVSMHGPINREETKSWWDQILQQSLLDDIAVDFYPSIANDTANILE